MNKIFKFLLLTFASFLALILLSAVFTQTAPFRQWLRNQVMAQAGSYLNASLILGNVQGNLFTRVRVDDILMVHENDSLFSARRFEFAYSPLALLRGEIQITGLLIEQPVVFAQRRPDGVWNFQHLLKTASLQRDSASAMQPQVNLSSIEVRGGKITIETQDSLKSIVRELEDVNADLAVTYLLNEAVVSIRKLEMRAADLPQLHSLRALVTQNSDGIQVKNLAARIGGSEISGELTLENLKHPQYSARFVASPLNLDDWKNILPQSYINGTLDLEGNITGDSSHVNGIVNLKYHDNAVDSKLEVRWHPFLAYDVEAQISAIDLNDFVPDKGLSTNLNGKLRLNGTGLTLPELDAKLEAELGTSRFNRHEISSSRFDVQVAGESIQAALFLQTHDGAKLSLQGMIDDPQQAQHFEIDARINNANLANFVADVPSSDLNLRLTGKGRGFDPQTLAFAGAIAMQRSRLGEFMLDSLYSVFSLDSLLMRCDTLAIKSESGDINGSGVAALKDSLQFRFNAVPKNLELVRRFFEMDTLRTRGNLTGMLTGAFDSLEVNGNFQLASTQLNTTYMDTSWGVFDFGWSASRMGGSILGSATNVVAGVVPFDSVSAEVQYDTSRAEVSVDFFGAAFDGDLDGTYTLSDTATDLKAPNVGRFDIHDATLHLGPRAWEAGSDSMWIEVGEEEYFFHNLELRSGPERLTAHGKLSYVGEENLRLTLENSELSTYAALIGYEKELRGRFEVEAILTGTAEAPQLNGHYLLSNGKFSEFAFEHWTGNFSYGDERLSWEFVLAQDTAKTLTGEGFIPLSFSLTDSALKIFDDKPFMFRAATTGLDLSFLQTFSERVKKLKGTLVFDFKMDNTLKAPEPRGIVRVFDGSLAVPELGTSFSDLRLALAILPNTVEVTFFNVVSTDGKGSLEGKATIKYDRSNINSASGRLQAKNFKLANTPDLVLLLDGDVRVGIDANQVKYSGEVIVQRSRFSVKGFQQRAVLEVEAEVPADGAQVQKAEADCTRVAGKPAASPLVAMLKNIDGELKIRIPRNTWIRGPEINLEIEGELDFIQQGERFSLFGTIDVVRGNYGLFGKRLDVDFGRFTFQGDLNTPPQIDLRATYRFRGRDARHVLYVAIKGNPQEPELSFYLDDEANVLEEKNALSYLLFNVPFEESGASGNVTNLTSGARGLVTALVSAQLVSSLGESLHLDVIEFNSGEELNQGSLLVGKYISDNIFVSFSQDFSTFSSANALKVALEYEIAKFLFLQAAKGGEQDKETGFDVIWKKEW